MTRLSALVCSMVLCQSIAALAAPGPVAVFHAYAVAANAADLDAIRTLTSPHIARPPFARCPPAQSGYDCMISYIDETVIQRHSTLTTLGTMRQGDVVLARVELRNDMTRAAGVERIAGTDRVKVVDGKMTEFAFLRDEQDAQTQKFFQFMAKARGSAPRPR